MITAAVPVLIPLHDKLEVADKLPVSGIKDVNIVVAVDVQPVALSNTLKVYVPGLRPDAMGEVWRPGLQVYE